MNPNEMSESELRIKVAELRGWKVENLGGKWQDNWRVTRPDGIQWRPSDPRIDVAALLPDYPNDLNAMHEAEKVLDRGQWIKYVAELSRISAPIWTLHSTARQRAFAFVATMQPVSEVSQERKIL